MYLYFDNNGTLKEVVNDKAIRQGSSNNYLFIYVAGVDYDETTHKYPFPSTYIAGQIDYKVINRVTDPWTTTPGTTPYTASTTPTYESLKTVAEIPWDKKRDLKFFEYHKNYEFLKVPVSDYLSGNAAGTFGATFSLMASVATSNLVLGMITFDIEESAIGPTVDLRRSDYNYLLNQLLGITTGYSKAEADAKFATYTYVDNRISGVDYEIIN